jgi:hypothetical protein
MEGVLVSNQHPNRPAPVPDAQGANERPAECYRRWNFSRGMTHQLEGCSFDQPGAEAVPRRPARQPPSQRTDAPRHTDAQGANERPAECYRRWNFSRGMTHQLEGCSFDQPGAEAAPRRPARQPPSQRTDAPRHTSRLTLSHLWRWVSSLLASSPVLSTPSQARKRLVHGVHTGRGKGTAWCACLLVVGIGGGKGNSRLQPTVGVRTSSVTV